MKTYSRRTSGFTLVELLIAVVIIGILVTIIVPVLSSRASDARIAAAQKDLDALTNAESQIALDTGYLVRLHVIDDSTALTDSIGPHDPLDIVDTIRDEQLSTQGNGDQIFIDVKTMVVQANPTIYDRAASNPETFGWKGPYANFSRKVKATTNPAAPPQWAGLDWTAGAPLDPWGNPYILIGLAGLQGGGLVSESTTTGGNGVNVATGAVSLGGRNADVDVFDRPTIVSMGPDGAPGSVADPRFGMGDDLYKQF